MSKFWGPAKEDLRYKEDLRLAEQAEKLERETRKYKAKGEKNKPPGADRKRTPEEKQRDLDDLFGRR